ncbi:MAG TPA: methyltransferase domain-containing protein [Xanthobacteraceae bacterium]
MTCQWVDCDHSTVARRYDRIASLIPLFEWLLFLPRDLRRRAVVHLGLRRGDSVLEIGCGTGRNFPHLRDAVGPVGQIYGVDISSGMLSKARQLRDDNHWHNIELHECDAAEFTSPQPLDAVLFSLSYNTMPHHRAVLRRAWQQLRPGGRLVILDAKVPAGVGEKLILPLSLWLMKRTLLGNPLIHPWKELAAIAEHVDMSECLFGSYYICRGMKPLVDAKTRTMRKAANGAAAADIEHPLAAE